MADDPVVKTLGRVIEERGGAVEWHHRPPLHGIAEQRDFLLRQATAETVLYLDDDVLMEPWVSSGYSRFSKMRGAALWERFPQGCHIATIGDPISRRSTSGRIRCYRRLLNWRAGSGSAGSCTGRRTSITLPIRCLLDHGGATRSPGSPPASSTIGASWRPWGLLVLAAAAALSLREEVLVQNLLMRRWGGCGMVPSGTYYSQVPTTVLNDRGSVDGHALDLLPEMVARYATAVGAGLVASPRAEYAGLSES